MNGVWVQDTRVKQPRQEELAAEVERKVAECVGRKNTTRHVKVGDPDEARVVALLLTRAEVPEGRGIAAIFPTDANFTTLEGAGQVSVTVVSKDDARFKFKVKSAVSSNEDAHRALENVAAQGFRGFSPAAAVAEAILKFKQPGIDYKNRTLEGLPWDRVSVEITQAENTVYVSISRLDPGDEETKTKFCRDRCSTGLSGYLLGRMGGWSKGVIGETQKGYTGSTEHPYKVIFRFESYEHERYYQLWDMTFGAIERAGQTARPTTLLIDGPNEKGIVTRFFTHLKGVTNPGGGGRHAFDYRIPDETEEVDDSYPKHITILPAREFVLPLGAERCPFRTTEHGEVVEIEESKRHSAPRSEPKAFVPVHTEASVGRKVLSTPADAAAGPAFDQVPEVHSGIEVKPEEEEVSGAVSQQKGPNAQAPAAEPQADAKGKESAAEGKPSGELTVRKSGTEAKPEDAKVIDAVSQQKGPNAQAPAVEPQADAKGKESPAEQKPAEPVEEEVKKAVYPKKIRVADFITEDSESGKVYGDLFSGGHKQASKSIEDLVGVCARIGQDLNIDYGEFADAMSVALDRLLQGYQIEDSESARELRNDFQGLAKNIKDLASNFNKDLFLNLLRADNSAS